MRRRAFERPFQPQPHERGADRARDSLDLCAGYIRLPSDHAGHAPLEDSGLLGSDERQRLAQIVRVVDRDRGDDGERRARNHIGGVEPAAEPHFEHQHIGGMAAEGMERRRRGDLEEGDRRAVVDRLAMGKARAQCVLGDRRAIEPDPLGEAYQMGRDVAVGAVAGGTQHRLEIGDHAALAVGAGDVDDRRRGALRVAECREQPGHAPEREVDDLGMEFEQPLEDRIALARHRALGRLRRPAHVSRQ